MFKINELTRNLRNRFFPSSSNKKPEEIIQKSMEELVYDCAVNGRDLDITCGTYKHSELVFQRILWRAEKSSVNLFVGGYGEGFYSREKIVQPFLDFVYRTDGEGRINVLAIDDEVDNLRNKEGLVGKLFSSYVI